MREIALRIWSKYIKSKEKVFIKDLIHREIEKSFLTNQEKAFISEILYGTCRNMLFLEYVISKFVKKKKKTLMPFLLLGVYQILFMNSVPDYAAVNETTELSKKMGMKRQAGFINAVLRNIARQKKEFIISKESVDKKDKRQVSVFLSYPYWFVEKIYKQYGCVNGFKILKAMNSSYNFNERMRKIFINGIEKDFFISENQEKVLKEVKIKKESKVIDVCSSPGTKSLLILKDYKNIKLICCDVNFKKLIKQKKYFDSFNLKNVFYLCFDASIYSPKRNVSFFDNVLCDVPCSNSGELSRRPEVRWKLKKEDIERFVLLQRGILKNSLLFLEKNGILVYSTCSIFKEENELTIRYVLKNEPNFVLVSEKIFIPSQKVPSGGYIAVVKRKN